MTSYNPMPFVILREFDDSGELLALGTVETYEAGTSTPLATFSDSNGTANTNPVVLDASGSASIFLQPKAYRLVFKDAAGNTVRTLDGINGVGSADGSTIATVSSYQALRDLGQDYDSIHVLGRTSIGDGGEGWFYQVAATADDDGIVLVRGTATSYRRMLGQSIDPRWFGLKYAVGTGSAQDSTISQAQAASAAYNLPVRYTGRLDIGNLVMSAGSAIFEQGSSVASASASPVVLTFSGSFAPASLPTSFVGNAVRLRWAACKEARTSWYTTDGTYSACDKLLYLGAAECQILVDADFRATSSASTGTFWEYAGGEIRLDEHIVFQTLGLYAPSVPWITFENSTALNSYITSGDAVNPVWFYGDSAQFWHACAASDVVEFPPNHAAQAGIWAALPDNDTRTLKGGTIAGAVSIFSVVLDRMQADDLTATTCKAVDSIIGDGSVIADLQAENCDLSSPTVTSSCILDNCRNNVILQTATVSAKIAGGTLSVNGVYDILLTETVSSISSGQVSINSGACTITAATESCNINTFGSSVSWVSDEGILSASGCKIATTKKITLGSIFSGNAVTGLSPHSGIVLVPTQNIAVTGCTFDGLPVDQRLIPDGVRISFRGCTSPVLGMGWRRMQPSGIDDSAPGGMITAICANPDGKILACRNNGSSGDMVRIRDNGFDFDNLNIIADIPGRTIATNGEYVVAKGQGTAALYSSEGRVAVGVIAGDGYIYSYYNSYWYRMALYATNIGRIEKGSPVTPSWAVYSPNLIGEIKNYEQMYIASNGDAFVTLPFSSRNVLFFDVSANSVSYPGIFGDWESSSVGLSSSGIAGNGADIYISARKTTEVATLEDAARQYSLDRNNSCLIFQTDGSNTKNTFLVGGVPSTNHSQLAYYSGKLFAVGNNGDILVSDGGCDVTFWGGVANAVSLVEG